MLVSCAAVLCASATARCAGEPRKEVLCGTGVWTLQGPCHCLQSSQSIHWSRLHSFNNLHTAHCCGFYAIKICVGHNLYTVNNSFFVTSQSVGSCCSCSDACQSEQSKAFHGTRTRYYMLLMRSQGASTNLVRLPTCIQQWPLPGGPNRQVVRVPITSPTGYALVALSASLCSFLFPYVSTYLYLWL
jgi:hypothetical protein